MKQSATDSARCELCQRQVALTAHHLIPRKMHRRQHFRKHYTRQQLNASIMICRPCHSGLHKLYDEMQLARYLNTLPLLKADTQVMKHVQWVAKQRVVND